MWKSLGIAVLMAASLGLTSASAQPQVDTTQTIEKGPDPDAIYCRPAQKQTFSRLLGPSVCKTNREWKALHDQGLDISADGKGTVESEKARSLKGNACDRLQSTCY